jgi:glutaredoxin 3
LAPLATPAIVLPENLAMNSVRMYTTQVCPFCVRAKALLKQRGVAEIDEIRIDLDPVARRQMMELTGRRTVPQIFIGPTHVGGCDDLIALDQRGGLLPLLGAAG